MTAPAFVKVTYPHRYTCGFCSATCTISKIKPPKKSKGDDNEKAGATVTTGHDLECIMHPDRWKRFSR